MREKRNKSPMLLSLIDYYNVARSTYIRKRIGNKNFPAIYMTKVNSRSNEARRFGLETRVS